MYGSPSTVVMYEDPSSDGREAKVLATIRSLVEARDLHGAGFSLSYREIGKYAGLSCMTVHDLIKKKLVGRYLLILDPGTKGERGLKTLYAFPEFAAQSESRPLVKQRAQFRAQEMVKAAERVVQLDDHRSPASKAVERSETTQTLASLQAASQSHERTQAPPALWKPLSNGSSRSALSPPGAAPSRPPAGSTFSSLPVADFSLVEYARIRLGFGVDDDRGRPISMNFVT